MARAVKFNRVVRVGMSWSIVDAVELIVLQALCLFGFECRHCTSLYLLYFRHIRVALIYRLLWVHWLFSGRVSEAGHCSHSGHTVCACGSRLKISQDLSNFCYEEEGQWGWKATYFKTILIKKAKWFGKALESFLFKCYNLRVVNQGDSLWDWNIY